MSFFDEADAPRRAPREPRGRRPSGRGRPPTDQQTVQTRRFAALAVVIVLIVAIALGVHSCDVSATNSSLRDYTNSVDSLIQRSDQSGEQLFRELSATGARSDPAGLQRQLDVIAGSTQAQLADAEGLSVPSAMQGAQGKLLLALRMRRDGVRRIAQEIEQALGTTESADAIGAIAVASAQFYASDVIYKSYVAPEMAGALHGDGIAVGGVNGETINPGQFVHDLSWLQPSFIATTLGSRLPSDHVNTAAPGLHGHVLNSVSVGQTTLSTTATNILPSSPAPSFTLNLTNGGQFTEYNVVCKVTVSGLGVSGKTTLPETTAGQTTDCTVPLSKAPTPGTYQVTAEVEPVPGESNTANNSLTFAVTFQ